LSPTLSAITAGLRGSSSGIPARPCHKIGADFGALREDAPPKPREDRDQRAAERKADERLDRVMQPFGHQVGACDAEPTRNQ
jgi:hypothetical protein